MTHVSISSRLALIALLVLTCFNSSPAAANTSVSASPADTLAADVPFSDDFESGTFGADWSTVKENNGVVEVNGDYPHSGAKSVFLGQKLAGNASASLVLALDLTGQTDVFLDFWVRATGGINYQQVYISDNGGTTWKLIREMNSTSQVFGHELLDLAGAAAANGLALNNKFRVKFFYGPYCCSAGRANDGLVIDDVRLAQRVQTVAPFPLTQDTFETGVFQQGLYPLSTLNGTTDINGDYPRSGAKSVFLGQKLAGHASASLVLALDLTGQTDVFLDFWVRATGGSNYRHVYISDDGGTTWELIRELNNTPQSFKREILNIADAATAEGLELNNKFRISFYYGFYSGRASDGMVVDDIQIGTQDPTAGLKVYLPLLRRPR